MGLIRFAGRALVGGVLVADGVKAFRQPEEHAELIAPYLEKVSDKLPDGVDATLVAKVAAGKLAAAGALAGLGLLPRLAGAAAALVLAPVTFLGYKFWEVKDDPEKKAEVLKGFATHAALLGGALLIAAGPKVKRVPVKGNGSGKKCCAKSKTKSGAKPAKGA